MNLQPSVSSVTKTITSFLVCCLFLTPALSQAQAIAPICQRALEIGTGLSVLKVNEFSGSYSEAEVEYDGQVYLPRQPINWHDFGSYNYLITDRNELVLGHKLAAPKNRRIEFNNGELTDQSQFLSTHRSLFRQLQRYRMTHGLSPQINVLAAGDLERQNGQIAYFSNVSGTFRGQLDHLMFAQDFFAKHFAVYVADTALHDESETDPGIRSHFNKHTHDYNSVRSLLINPHIYQWMTDFYAFLFAINPIQDHTGRFGSLSELLTSTQYYETAPMKETLAFLTMGLHDFPAIHATQMAAEGPRRWDVLQYLEVLDKTLAANDLPAVPSELRQRAQKLFSAEP